MFGKHFSCVATNDVQQLIRTISRLPDPEYDPESFAPERFLRADPPLNPALYGFGFGRRRCPGSELAENFLFVVVASILSAFEIGPAQDKNGVEISINPRYSSGLVRYDVLEL